jgi:hypothetical protein
MTSHPAASERQVNASGRDRRLAIRGTPEHGEGTTGGHRRRTFESAIHPHAWQSSVASKRISSVWDQGGAAHGILWTCLPSVTTAVSRLGVK